MRHQNDQAKTLTQRFWSLVSFGAGLSEPCASVPGPPSAGPFMFLTTEASVPAWDAVMMVSVASEADNKAGGTECSNLTQSGRPARKAASLGSGKPAPGR